MRAYDCIAKKRDGGELTEEEIHYMISSYVSGKIPDYQMAAFLMAVYFRGMTDRETAVMTQAVAHSGDIVDLSGIQGIKVDKHSTGGVGDKTTLIVAPVAAACGVKVAKMSGRGLGHTGGTIDKLESIPGFSTSLSKEKFIDVANRTGLSIAGQSGNLAPADKKMYALRDVTATVDSIPLIAVSIMGKKLASGSDCILLDVKTGSGAFMKTLEDSAALARCMVAIGEAAGKRTAALITNMDEPLGNYIGNALEVKEAVEVLKGGGPSDLRQLSLRLAAGMLELAGKGSAEECLKQAEEALNSGRALERLLAMVKAQGGDEECILDTDKLSAAPLRREVKKCGIASMLLGAGRETKESVLDYGAGIILKKKPGDRVAKGETMAVLFASKEELFFDAEEKFREAVEISEERPKTEKMIFGKVSREGVELF